MSAAAAAFAERWQGKGYERGESQLFWADLLANVYGVEDLPAFIRYEERVSSMVDSTNFIDGHIPSTRVLIEQKSLGKDLRAPVTQSDGGKLTPFQQAKKYVANMPLSQHPKWIVTCNFEEFLVYDMERPNGEPEQILLKNLGKEYYRLQFLVDSRSEHLAKELQVSMKAGEIVGKMYDALLERYDDNSPEALRWLNILCVRLVFCMYAEDAGVFRHDQFHDFLNGCSAEDLNEALQKLFSVLNTPLEKRSKYLKDDLKAFPYTNGGLFEEEIEIPIFTEKLKQTLLQNASLDFDWSEISPTIFGAVFESTLNPVTRRGGGMHYTSIENIHKVIDPLFLNDLRNELDEILTEKVEKQRVKKLEAYQDKLASLTFLDPACGSGNFLTETYLSLRRLENEALRERYHGQMMMGAFLNPVKVSIHQFYGIEINDFAVTVATTALWISEAQMLAETERIIQHDIDFLPLKSYANIKEGNALRMDWSTLEFVPKTNALFTEKLNVYQVDNLDAELRVEEPGTSYNTTYQELNVVAKQVEHKQFNPRTSPSSITYDYIIGNPPFVGYGLQTMSQKEDTLETYIDEKGKSYKTAGKIDYVANWFFKAAKLIQGTSTRCAFVSTNSIMQGEQVANVWKPILNRFKIHFDFAYKTFKWGNEGEKKDMAAVHCVIIAFSSQNTSAEKKIFTNETQSVTVDNINPYLIDAPVVWIESRKKPICNVPIMTTGNRPADGGHLIIEADEYDDFIKEEPSALPYIKKITGAEEFINNKKRYCLWLVGVSPAVIRGMKKVYQRVQLCREDRLKGAPDRQKLALTPALFREISNPEKYLIIPRVSSESRCYIPIGFLDSDTIPTDSATIIVDAGLYEFGILISTVHMAWMRVVCGRLKSDYRYSKDIVYNNFPWPGGDATKGGNAGSVASKRTSSPAVRGYGAENVALGSVTSYVAANNSDVGKCRLRIEQTAQAILDVRAKYPDCSLADLYDEAAMPPDLRKAHQENDRAVMAAYGFDLKMSESECVAELFRMYTQLTTES
ncbi:MAG: DNA methyltransferase [Bacteroidales bacterium]|nr:DNA methyltransferase [Bacteroidales bacterium]